MDYKVVMTEDAETDLDNFMSHRYFMLYRVEGDRAIIDNILHELQDYENRLC